MTTWRYLAFSAPGGDYLGEVPLTDVRITRALSRPGSLEGSLDANLPEFVAMMRAWHVTIWAVADGQIRGGGILTPSGPADSTLPIDCVGISGYPKGQPWVGSIADLVRVDPLDVVRVYWQHLQEQPGGNLGVTVDAINSPVKIGSAGYFTNGAGAVIPESEAYIAFVRNPGDPRPVPDPVLAPGVEKHEAEPYRVNWWSLYDLGAEIDKLAASTPFEYLEETALVGGATLSHRLRLGYPQISARRPDLRFAIGENVAEVPPLIADDDDYASEVVAYGAGEERSMVRAGIPPRTHSGLRRARVFVDKAANDPAALSESAWRELEWRDGSSRIERLRVIDHEHAPLGSFDVGDEVRVTGRTAWGELDRWVRITELVIEPESAAMTLRVEEK